MDGSYSSLVVLLGVTMTMLGILCRTSNSFLRRPSQTRLTITAIAIVLGFVLLIMTFVVALFGAALP